MKKENKMKKEKIKEFIDEIIEEYELDYGNSETCIQEDDVFFNLEAPNNGTIGKLFHGDATKKEIVKEIVDTLLSFNADDEFDCLYNSVDFKPSEFIDMLKEDEKYFKDTAEKMSLKYING
jgi:predicted nucleic-acid-binding protein